MTSANPGDAYNYLYAASATSMTDAWAVGHYLLGSGIPSTLTEHWDGSAWTQVSSPSPSTTGDNVLQGVSADSPSDAWAVGQYQENSSPFGYETLTEHWDGTSWSVVSSASPGLIFNLLASVVALSPTTAWAVGWYHSEQAQRDQTLIEYWNGNNWSPIPSPNAGAGDNHLFHVATIPHSKALVAVGEYYESRGSKLRTLVERFNGSEWKIVTSPNRKGALQNYLNAVAVSGTGQAWAVGESYDSTYFGKTLTEMSLSGGKSWAIVPSQSPGSSDNELYGVAMAPNAVAVGIQATPSTSIALVERWTGARWKACNPPSPGSQFNWLQGVARIPGTRKLFTVGWYTNGQVPQTLIEML